MHCTQQDRLVGQKGLKCSTHLFNGLSAEILAVCIVVMDTLWVWLSGQWCRQMNYRSLRNCRVKGESPAQPSQASHQWRAQALDGVDRHYIL